MKHLATMVLCALLFAGIAEAQFEELAGHNLFQTKVNWTGPDSLKPYTRTPPERADQTLGVRTAWVANDLDKDGKPEILATDYTKTGRIHVFEYNGTNTLELVWSTPRRQNTGGNSLTPRWVRDGDLDGDGNREIIFAISLRNSQDSAVQVFEWSGTDNDFGTEPAFELTASLFLPQRLGKFHTGSEVAEVQDIDGDGRDELLMANRDRGLYILGVVGDFPEGFASWNIEGGTSPANPDNGFSAGTLWHPVPADLDGDGKKEIVVHHYSNYGFWSVDPVGPDSYRYPTPSLDSASIPEAKRFFYHEFLSVDAVSYMGVVPIDVDGDAKQEIAGIAYGSNSDVALVALSRSDSGVYVWRDSTQFGIIGKKMWTLAGKTAGENWGSAAYDYDGNGRQEYLIGGSGEYNVIAMEYGGSGSILDAANYTSRVVFPGDPDFYYFYDIYDSLGIIDTVRTESPFVSKMFAGCDLDGDGQKELVCAYQSVQDSVTYIYHEWDTLALPLPKYVVVNTVKVVNTDAVNIKVLEWTGAVFVEQPVRFVTPEDYVLEQNYPNPFNPSTTIRFSLPLAKNISLTVHDMLGREVKRLIADEIFTAGAHAVEWNGTDNLGKPVASGNYVYTLRFGNFTKSAKMTLLK